MTDGVYLVWYEYHPGPEQRFTRSTPREQIAVRSDSPVGHLLGHAAQVTITDRHGGVRTYTPVTPEDLDIDGDDPYLTPMEDA